MKITKFKTLIYMDNYVDVNKLNSGIYSSIKPTIYSSDETIQSLIEKTKMMQMTYSKSIISEEYIENLKECELIDIEINIVNK
jgi:hypothetical protein